MGWLKRRRSPDNRALEACMQALAEGDSVEKLRAFYAALRSSTLMIATPGMEPGEREKVAEERKQFRFIATTDLDGKSAMLVFTSEAALLAWRPVGCVYTALAARDVFNLALKGPADHILINVRGPVGGRVERREIRTLAEGLDPIEDEQHLAPGTRIEIAPPAAPPADALLDALRTVAGAAPSIRALFLVTATIGDGEPAPLIGVEISREASRDDVFRALQQAVQPVIGENGITFLPMSDDPVGASIRARGLRVV